MGKKVFTNIVWMLTTGVSCALGAAVYFRFSYRSHFQVGGDNSKVEGGSCNTSMQSKAILYFHFDIFILENKVGGGNTIRQAICPVSGCCGMPWDLTENGVL